jgi:hypothetical protein
MALWVKLKPNTAAEVTTLNCTNVYQFIKEVKKELSPRFDAVPNDQISLALTDGGAFLEPHDTLPPQNTGDSPLYITVAGTSGHDCLNPQNQV